GSPRRGWGRGGWRSRGAATPAWWGPSPPRSSPTSSRSRVATCLSGARRSRIRARPGRSTSSCPAEPTCGPGHERARGARAREVLMDIRVFATKAELGRAAAVDAAAALREAIEEKGRAHVIAATGASQFEFLDALTATTAIDWPRVVFFHLDEYVGLPESHPASFRRYLKERIVARVRPGGFHFIEGDAADPAAEARRVGELIRAHPIDAAFVGIGENGHLAFNDPPADFESEQPYLLVTLDEACRRQQLGEGWFKDFEEVPRRAISMSVG